MSDAFGKRKVNQIDDLGIIIKTCDAILWRCIGKDCLKERGPNVSLAEVGLESISMVSECRVPRVKSEGRLLNVSLRGFR